MGLGCNHQCFAKVKSKSSILAGLERLSVLVPFWYVQKVMSGTKALFAVLLLVTAGTASGATGLLADEPFLSVGVPLQGLVGGSGWGGAWQVQNGAATVPGYSVTNAAPLQSSGVAQSGGYATGGLNYQSAGRLLDTSSTGPFASYLASGSIGLSGKSILVSFLLREDKATGDDVFAALHNQSGAPWWIPSTNISAGVFGSSRYWALRVNGVAYPSKVAVVPGQAALLVLRLDFGATTTVSLFVNPTGASIPSTANVAVSTAPFTFCSFAWYGGSGPGLGSLDEIRFAPNYSSLALQSIAPPAAPQNLTATPGNGSASLVWSPVTGASSYRVYQSIGSSVAKLEGTATASNLNVTGLVNGTSYSYCVTAVSGSVEGPSSPCAVVVPRRPAPVSKAVLGSNLSALADWSREWPFVDAFKIARPWIPQQQGAAWGTGPALQLDANGWVTKLQPGQYAETILFDNSLEDATASYPTGNYTLLYDGTGTLDFDLNSASIVSQTPGRMVVNVPKGNGIFLRLLTTDPANPLRNIRFIMPGFESTYLKQPFHPLFLSRLQGYKALRFMEWARINGSTVTNWSDRAQPADYTYTSRGVPLEVMISLANTLGAAPWFNIPAQATDSYVLQFAATVHSQLKSGLKFYVEYSNETWNGAFSQNAYIRSKGLAGGLSTDPVLAAAYYTALRSTQIFTLFTSVVGTASPMVRVIASQAANSWLSEQTVMFQNAFAQADALAIAPYFNCSEPAGFGMLGDPSTAAQVDVMSVDQILDIALQHVNGCALQQMQSNSAVAAKYGLAMVAYEAGQSLVGYNGAENDGVMDGLFKAANRNARMGAIYTQYLNNWVSSGGDLIVHFNDVGAYTKYGSWGSLEYQDQDPATSPKFLALSSFLQLHP